MKRNNYLLLLIPIFTISLLLQTDLFASNLSYLSHSLNGYLLLLLLAILSAILSYIVLKDTLSKKDLKYLIFAYLLMPLVPYIEASVFIGNIHIILAYLANFIILYITIKFVFEIYFINIKKAKILFYIVFISSLIIFYLWLKYGAIIGLMELIYISAVQLIFIIGKLIKKC